MIDCGHNDKTRNCHVTTVHKHYFENLLSCWKIYSFSKQQSPLGISMKRKVNLKLRSQKKAISAPAVPHIRDFHETIGTLCKLSLGFFFQREVKKKLLKSTKCQWQSHQSGEVLAGQMWYKTTTKSFCNERTKRHYDIMRHYQLNPVIPWNPPGYTYQTPKPKSGNAGECLARTWWGAQVMGRSQRGPRVGPRLEKHGVPFFFHDC